MFKVKVITQGRCKETWLAQAIEEYMKRMQGKMQIEWVLIEKKQDFQEKILKEPSFIALDLKGQLYSSKTLSQKLFSDWGLRPVFVIGGFDGIPHEIINRARDLWCLSPLTFTHQIVRLLLVEQLYRALEIEEGSRYHK